MGKKNFKFTDEFRFTNEYEINSRQDIAPEATEENEDNMERENELEQEVVNEDFEANFNEDLEVNFEEEFSNGPGEHVDYSKEFASWNNEIFSTMPVDVEPPQLSESKPSKFLGFISEDMLLLGILVILLQSPKKDMGLISMICMLMFDKKKFFKRRV